MSLLVSAEELESRKVIASGELAPLAMALRHELSPVIDEPPDVPREKALLSRAGGRCAIDGAQLTFDPYDPRHICPRCGRENAGGLHDRYRLYWYQLWLAERTVHAALLGVLMNDAACTATAITLLDRYADQYPGYPNADNVLGPSRPFFSTYLESIWVLQLTLALDLLETGSPSPEVMSLGARVRDRLIGPSAALIASFDEGMSNRQVWNNAAMLAAAGMLDDRVLSARALRGKSGLHAHLETALLADGSWYEGENYHLFAHRGLWYGVQLADAAGLELPPLLRDRYHEAFAAPFRTILPDLTYPSRRDSQYAVSIRQPRFAESCELGLQGRDDPRLVGMLARLYDPAIPRRDTGRAASSADVERNLPATGLSRVDLSWRSLLFARAVLPPLTPVSLRSDVLPAQGLGILRRDDGNVYVSLDYGHSGGGHGHPDRLNFTLVDGVNRWFDDPGTGSYVDTTLHWYRSTLAHNAPLVDGHSQPREHGELLAYQDDDHIGWLSGHVSLAPGLDVRRTVVVLDDYLVDELSWEGEAPHEIALPIHGVETRGEDPRTRIPASIVGGTATEDGFSFLSNLATLVLSRAGPAQLRGVQGGVGTLALRGWIVSSDDSSLWSATAPPPPNRREPEPMILIRQASSTGQFTGVWTWREAVADVALDGHELTVTRHDGSVDRHARRSWGWEVQRDRNGTTVGAELRGVVPARHSRRSDLLRPASELPAIPLPASLTLEEPHYRRSEFTWEGAGAPRAKVSIARRTPGTVQVDIDVPHSQRLFVPLVTENQLDNEPASINGDSVQLYAIAGGRTAGLLLVPEGPHVGIRRVDGWTNDLSVDPRWRPLAGGYRMEVTLHIGNATPEFMLDVMINDVVAGRARRRGQLVLSGAHGEFVYLRGDRQDASRLLRFSLANV